MKALAIIGIIFIVDILVIGFILFIARKNALSDHNEWVYSKYLHDKKARRRPSLDLETLLNGQAEAAITAADELDDLSREHHKKFKS